MELKTLEKDLFVYVSSIQRKTPFVSSECYFQGEDFDDQSFFLRVVGGRDFLPRKRAIIPKGTDALILGEIRDIEGDDVFVFSYDGDCFNEQGVFVKHEGAIYGAQFYPEREKSYKYAPGPSYLRAHSTFDALSMFSIGAYQNASNGFFFPKDWCPTTEAPIDSYTDNWIYDFVDSEDGRIRQIPRSWCFEDGSEFLYRPKGNEFIDLERLHNVPCPYKSCQYPFY